MSATTALDGVGAVEGTGGRRARARLDGATHGTNGRAGAAPTSPVGLAARPRAATPVFVDGGRRARWVRRLGAVAGVALASWLASVGLALVGLGSTAGPSLATDRAVVHQPAVDQPAVDQTARSQVAGADEVASLFTTQPEPPAPAGGDAAGGGAVAGDAAPATAPGDLPSLLAPSDVAGSAPAVGRTPTNGGGEGGRTTGAAPDTRRDSSGP